MSISVCLIVHHDGLHLPRAMESVKAVADELIVVVAGADDSALKAAAQCGARAVATPWNSDLSAVWNAAVEMAGGDSIFLMESDEWLLPQCIMEIRRCATADDALGFFITREDVLDEAQPENLSLMRHLRLFRRRSDARFVGRCHPDFSPPLPQIAQQINKKISPSAVVLRHDGYAGAQRMARLRQDAALLELELSDHPDRFYYLVELGRTLLLLGDPRGHGYLRQATELLYKHRDDMVAPSVMAAALLEHLMRMTPTVSQSPFTRSELHGLANRWFPNSAPLIWLESQWYYDQENFTQAAVLLNKLIDLGRQQAYDQSCSFDPRIVGDDARLNLGVCYMRSAELAKAEKQFAELLESPTAGAAARENIAIVRDLRRRIEQGQKRDEREPRDMRFQGDESGYII